MNFYFNDLTSNPSILNRFKHWLIRTLFFVSHVVNSDLKQILTLDNSDLNPIRTLADSDPISKKKLLANSDRDFAGSELTSGRGPN